ncbi:hypothetical protein [Nocardia sp. NPDC046763]|uniref:hypothetical protein n=1 Tax=Nocardia sp. NPDC046763 TaxID=3155256 RepID=UPI0033C8B5D3
MGELRQDLTDTIAALRSGRVNGDREALKAFRARLERLGFRLKDVFDTSQRTELARLHREATALWQTLWQKACTPPS